MFTTQRAQVQFLVREVRSYMPHCVAKKITPGWGFSQIKVILFNKNKMNLLGTMWLLKPIVGGIMNMFCYF